MAAVPEESKLSYNFLGRSGLKVANICLGTVTFGNAGLQGSRPGQATEEYSHQVLDRYVQWGGNFLDTADVYSQGVSEKFIGSWLTKQSRDQVVVATKVRGNMPYGVGLSRRHIVQSIKNSLERLQTDYVDLYQMHKWDDGTPIEETLRTFDDLVRCGKVRYVGASNVLGWQLQKIACTTEKLGMNPFISLQQQYSLVCRESEFEPFQVCKTEGLGVLPWSPLKGGLLSGKYTRESPPTTGRLGWRREKDAGSWNTVQENDQMWAIMDAVRDIANTHGKSMAQVSLRWLLQKDVVPSVIIGATTLSQLDDNLGAASGWTLSSEEMARLDEVSEPRQVYPFDLWKHNKSRRNPFQSSYLVSNTN
ncbi:1-deoxyxylulose-5-phosphate synthase YajO-like [Haliotis rufescens]|uniref:1-deoxyxylulose-5-phosphate synthase YajO-like n=1 Tax=Haliotis rufescens TaxID=6454 RepID=UPI00201FAB14|nr:1-deoxyxylulose-5-phosphate synthase YajO-like [Haliotis rufescens]